MPLEGREAQVEEVLDRLYEECLDTTISLSYSNYPELLIAVMLSIQCVDKYVSKATAELSEKYDDIMDYAAADQEKLVDDISSITYYNNKVKYIHSACADIIKKHDDEVSDTMSTLTDLAGVDRRTASVVLQHGHDIVEGVVADTHVQQFLCRSGLAEKEYPERIEEDLVLVVSERDWQRFMHLFIGHGRAVCGTCNPDCDTCVLEDLCPSSKRGRDVDPTSGET